VGVHGQVVSDRILPSVVLGLEVRIVLAETKRIQVGYNLVQMPCRVLDSLKFEGVVAPARQLEAETIYQVLFRDGGKKKTKEALFLLEQFFFFLGRKQIPPGPIRLFNVGTQNTFAAKVHFFTTDDIISGLEKAFYNFLSDMTFSRRQRRHFGAARVMSI
jgi:hypothetical protein